MGVALTVATVLSPELQVIGLYFSEGGEEGWGRGLGFICLREGRGDGEERWALLV